MTTINVISLLKKYVVLFYIIILMNVSGLKAQIIIFNNTLVNLSENTNVAIAGSFSNEGSLTNNGNLYVSQNWENRGNFNAQSGTVIFNGADIQHIYHNNSAFYNLIIEGSEKRIEENIDITGTLYLNSGIVTPSGPVIISLNENAVIGSASDISFINGALYTVGTGDKFYPVGKNTSYRPVHLYNITGDNPVTGIELFEPNDNALPGIGLRNISQERYWQRSQLSGTFDGAFAGVPFYNDINFQNAENVVVAQAETSGSVFENLGRRSINGSDEIVSNQPFNQNLITLAEIDGLSIINIITPNNDGINDYLTISNIERYPENELIVIDRLGNKVFNAKNYDNTWTGEEVPEGNYYCIFKIKGSDKVYKQTISIIK